MSLLKQEIPKLQLYLRESLLEKASSETKRKFTGKGCGDNSILFDDAEEIVATVMTVIKARRSNTVIEIDGAEFKAKDYNEVGSGVAKLMNWNGYVYACDSDTEHTDRSLVEVEFPDYVKDYYMGGKDKDEKVYAAGKVVTPNRLKTLVDSFNYRQAEGNKIAWGGNITKKSYRMADIGYLYFGESDIRRINTDGTIGLEWTTLMKQKFKGKDLVFGARADEDAKLNVLEWML